MILLQIEPPAADRGFGGRTFFRRINDVATIVERDLPLDIELVEPADVVGEITLVHPEADCGTRPVKVRLTPVEHYLGVSVASYEGESVVELDPDQVIQKVEPSILRNSYRLHGVPEGSYDVYLWENEPPLGVCEIAPQLQRDVDFRTEEGEGTLRSLTLSQTLLPPGKLSVQVPWRAELFGWSLAVVHPVTGELMSTQAQLTEPVPAEGASAQAPLFAEEDLWVAQVGASDYVSQGELRLQLSPPTGVQRPSVSASLNVLVTGTEAEPVAAVSNLRPFEDLVQLRSWVWRAGQSSAPVAGAVRFEARQLAEVAQAIRARLSVTAPIQDEGVVEAQLPPGIYEATVIPEPTGELGVDRLAAIRHTVEVFVSAGGDTVNIVQSGRVLDVPIAPVLSGGLSLAAGSGDLSRFDIQAVGVQPNVVDTAASEDLRAPEGISRLVDDPGGRFRLPVPDCGGCRPEAQASYDLRVVPPPGSHFPWTIAPGIGVHEDLQLGEVEVGVPAKVAGVLTFKTIATRDREARAFPGALIRAYALLNRRDELVTDPQIPYCYELRATDRDLNTCIARAVQIGQTRSVQGGQFELLLPTRLERIPVTE